jgi:hypothetical protein
MALSRSDSKTLSTDPPPPTGWREYQENVPDASSGTKAAMPILSSAPLAIDASKLDENVAIVIRASSSFDTPPQYARRAGLANSLPSTVSESELCPEGPGGTNPPTASQAILHHVGQGVWLARPLEGRAAGKQGHLQLAEIAQEPQGMESASAGHSKRFVRLKRGELMTRPAPRASPRLVSSRPTRPPGHARVP